MPSRRGLCPVCKRELQVTAAGVIRSHGYAMGAGDQSCPGSGKEPLEAATSITCLTCLGLKATKFDGTEPVNVCPACNGDGVQTLEKVARDPVVQMVQEGLASNDAPDSSSHTAALAVLTMLRDGWQNEHVVEEQASLMAELMQFYHAWKTVSRGPQKPELVEKSERVEKAWDAVRSAEAGL